MWGERPLGQSGVCESQLEIHGHDRRTLTESDRPAPITHIVKSVTHEAHLAIA